MVNDMVYGRPLWVFSLLGWRTKVYVQTWLAPSNGILHRFCLTKESTLTSQDCSSSSVVCILEPIRAIWLYLPSIQTQLVVVTLCQFWPIKVHFGKTNIVHWAESSAKAFDLSLVNVITDNIVDSRVKIIYPKYYKYSNETCFFLL